MLAWRAQVADKRNENCNATMENKMTRQGIAHLEEADAEDDGDDIRLIIDLMRNQNAQQAIASSIRGENVEEYLAAQIADLKDIYEASDLSNQPQPIAYSSEILKRSNQPYIALTSEHCEKTLKKLTTELKDVCAKHPQKDVQINKNESSNLSCDVDQLVQSFDINLTNEDDEIEEDEDGE